METIYLVAFADYGDYLTHSAWSKEEEAETIAELLNRGEKSYGHYFVEKVLLNCMPETEQFCVQATYSTKKYGYTVTTENIKFEEQIVIASILNDSKATISSYGVIKVLAGSKEDAEHIICAKAAEMQAKS